MKIKVRKLLEVLGEVEEVGKVAIKDIDQVTMVVGKKGTLLRVESEIKGKKEMAWKKTSKMLSLVKIL